VIWLYRILFLPLLFLLAPYYLWRMRRRGGYTENFSHRFGGTGLLPPKRKEVHRIWLQAVSVSKSMLAHFELVREIHRFFAGEFVEAWKIARQLDELLVFVPGMMTVAEHAFYQCLTATALWPRLEGDERAALEARLEQQSAALETWAAHCPANYLAQSLTVQAERARLRGDVAGAGQLYERAAGAARESHFVNVEAIACELAMNHWRRHDAARSEAMRERAVAAYSAWGATRKVNALRLTPARGS